MALKTIIGTLVLLLLASIGWRYRQSEWAQTWVQTWVQTEHKPKAIVFDNGTVRELALPVPASAASAPLVALHAMRKCRRGAEVVYTDNPCQKGFQELPIRSGLVTVLEGQAAPKKTGSGPVPATSRPGLLDVLDESGNSDLRAKRLERIIDR